MQGWKRSLFRRRASQPGWSGWWDYDLHWLSPSDTCIFHHYKCQTVPSTDGGKVESTWALALNGSDAPLCCGLSDLMESLDGKVFECISSFVKRRQSHACRDIVNIKGCCTVKPHCTVTTLVYGSHYQHYH